MSGHLDGPPGPPDPPLRFDNATTVREIAYRCAGAGSGAVMRLASDVVMPAAEIGEAVEEILCDFWPEAAADRGKQDEQLSSVRSATFYHAVCLGCEEPPDEDGAEWRATAHEAAEVAAEHGWRDGRCEECQPVADREKPEACRAPHCWSEYGTPCGTCPSEPRPENPYRGDTACFCPDDWREPFDKAWCPQHGGAAYESERSKHWREGSVARQPEIDALRTALEEIRRDQSVRPGSWVHQRAIDALKGTA